MKCESCGAKIKDRSEYCNKCGAKQLFDDIQAIHNPNPVTSIFIDLFKRNKIIFSVCGIVFVAVITIIIFQISNPINQFMKNMNGNNYTQAMVIYDSKIKGNSQVEKQIKEKLTAEAKDLYTNYKNGKIDYTTALNKFREIHKTYLIDKEISPIMDDANKLNNSRTAFEQGTKDINSKDYRNAIIQFNKVISEDSNYKKSNELIQISINQWTDDIKSKGTNLKDQIEIKKQIDNISEVLTVIGQNDNLQNVEDTLKEKYSSDILNQANLLVKKNDFSGAIELLNQNKNYEFKSNLSERATSIQSNDMKAYNTNKFNQLKSQFTIQYDKIDNMYIIVPKGYDTKHNNLTNSINVEPRITVTGDIINYMLISGFVQDDWIFMDRVTFASDDKRHEYKVGFTDRQTQVLDGAGIAEWYVMADDSDGSITGLVSCAVDLTDLINDISKSSNNQIRFSGKGNRDHTISGSEKNNIIKLWQFYKLLKNDGSLIKSLE